MKIPGEALIEKLWSSLVDKGVGSLLKPWQIRREGQAQVDVKRLELLALAQAERDAEAIRQGKASFSGELLVFSPPIENGHLLLPNERFETNKEELEALLLAAQRSAAADALKKEVHVAKAIIYAESELAGDSAPTPDEALGEDWLYRWKNYAGAVTSDELQTLWGRVLAGEVKSPGQYSMRFMSFLHKLSQEEAKLIEKAMPFIIDGMIYREADNLLEKEGITFSKILELQELGVLSGAEAIGLSRAYKSNGQQGLAQLLQSYNLAIGVRHTDPNVGLELSAYIITSLGKQLSTLGSFEPNIEYLKLIGKKIKEKGFSVEIGKPVNAPDGMIYLIDSEKL